MLSKYVSELLEKGERMDGRDFLEWREIEILPNVIKKAEGSASVRFGRTHVIAGVKLEISKPFPDNPNEGILIVNAEFPPIASPFFEPGPPDEKAIELARVIDRMIRESKMIESEKLVIGEEKVWGVFVDIHVMNDAGNLMDAAALASVAALLNTKIPKIEEESILRGEYIDKLPVVHKPVMVTLCKIKDKILIDPTNDEEEIIESKISFGIREDNVFCAIQKQGKSIPFNMVKQMIDLALEKSKELRSKLNAN